VSLAIRELGVEFQVGAGIKRQTLRALHQVDLEVRPGQAVAVVGESGSGKSTLAKAIAGLVTPVRGSIQYLGRELVGQRWDRTLRGQIQMVFQDPFASLNPVFRIRHHLERPLKLHGRPESVREMLERVGLDPAFADAYPHELSGGQRQRVNIARALAPGPRVLLADEPTSMLDVSSRMDILRLLDRLRRDHDLALMFITHDLAAARWLCDDVMVLYAGQVMEYAGATEIVADPRHPYTRLLLAAAPRPGHRLDAPLPARPGHARNVDPLPGCPFVDRCLQALPACSRRHPETIGSAHRVACHLETP
jgi:peptide/nickel transport system ATP-binding protein